MSDTHELVPLGTQEALRSLVDACEAYAAGDRTGWLDAEVKRCRALVEGVERTHTPASSSATCLCEGPLAGLGPGGSCPVHGLPETKRRLVECEDALRSAEARVAELEQSSEGHTLVPNRWLLGRGPAMIGNGRLVFVVENARDVVGTFSVEPNGWVTKWLDSNPEVVEAMHPPSTVFGLFFCEGSADEPGPTPTRGAGRMPENATETIKAASICRGDRIWAPDDGDWLRVHRVERHGFGDVIVYRIDGSEACFSPDKNVLRQVAANTGSGT